ncbi:AAC(3) family N-acetyltransferase [Adlercreutzia sp. ZJ242]|uniref:AAC(3) family N-acetyltransferase n=1 Tax=Adlercreutzia sp. ZJ242 TaxID=2709409 RepID=UPI0013EA38DA|nr:AAC(3) family N-acetyltransferase [Adlercreutzia sp. ZJ242]
MKESLRKLTRQMIRNSLSCRENETIRDCVERKKVKLSARLDRVSYGVDDLRKALIRVNVRPGDILMVHCAWRSFYNFSGSPDDVIECLLELLGEEGTLLMPAYGKDLHSFDVMDTPSVAGVLSEVFRKREGVIRSESSHFSVAGTGPATEKLFSYCGRSMNGFDENSAYGSFARSKNSKVLIMGLGREPTKLSLVHVSEYNHIRSSESCKRMFDKTYDAVLVLDSGVACIRQMVTWSRGGQLNDAEIRKVYRNIPSYREQHLGRNYIVCVKASEAMEYIDQRVEEGVRFTFAGS